MSQLTWRQWGKVYTAGAGIIFTGVILFKYTTPRDEELIAKFSPEVRKEYEKARNLRQEEQKELMKIVQRTACSNEPIWKTGPIKSPWDVSQSNKLNDNFMEQIHRDRAKRREEDEVDESRTSKETQLNKNNNSIDGNQNK